MVGTGSMVKVKAPKAGVVLKLNLLMIGEGGLRLRYCGFNFSEIFVCTFVSLLIFAVVVEKLRFCELEELARAV